MYFITNIFRKRCKNARKQAWSNIHFMHSAKSESSIFTTIIVESIDNEENVDKYIHWFRIYIYMNDWELKSVLIKVNI